MTKKQKKVLYRILISAALMIFLDFLPVQGMLRFLLYLVPYLMIGHDILRKAYKGILHKQVFDENFLMATATIGAMVIGVTSSGDYVEAIAVMLFYQIGELFQSYAVGKSRQSIKELMNICPEYANLEVDGCLEQIDPDEVEVGAFIVIKAGERVPLDGVVVDGESFVDTSALTGESVPRRIKAGDEIVSGCVNKSSLLRVRVTKEFEDSTVSRILELVENASSKKAKVEKFITRFARYYTPIVTICAFILALIPPILLQGTWSVWLERACIFLVISCPCALVISVPMGFFGGIGAASKIGVLVKGSNYLESLSEMDTIVFDKTGTLTNGVFEVTKIVAKEIEETLLLELTAFVESSSTHPIAESICNSYEQIAIHKENHRLLDGIKLIKQEECSGQGIISKLCIHMPEMQIFSKERKQSYANEKENDDNNKINESYKEEDIYKVLVGNHKLMEANDISYEKYDGIGSVVYVAINEVFAGYLVVSDKIKEGSKQAITALKKTGIKKTVMLTGDRKEVALEIAKTLGMDDVCYELLPSDKVEKVEELLKHQIKGHRLAFVGDGINDAPVLARADIGFAMGSLGSDAAIEAADVVIMDDDIRKIARVTKISRKTMSIVKQNILFALGVKGLILILGAVGYASMWAAVFADVGVAVIAILNSMRALNEK